MPGFLRGAQRLAIGRDQPGHGQRHRLRLGRRQQQPGGWLRHGRRRLRRGSAPHQRLVLWLAGRRLGRRGGTDGTLPEACSSAMRSTASIPSLAEDKYGVTWGYLRWPARLARQRRRPQRRAPPRRRRYVALQRSVSDFDDFTFAAWIKCDGGLAGQRLFEFRGGDDRFMYLTRTTVWAGRSSWPGTARWKNRSPPPHWLRLRGITWRSPWPAAPARSI